MRLYQISGELAEACRDSLRIMCLLLNRLSNLNDIIKALATADLHQAVLIFDCEVHSTIDSKDWTMLAVYDYLVNPQKIKKIDPEKFIAKLSKKDCELNQQENNSEIKQSMLDRFYKRCQANRRAVTMELKSIMEKLFKENIRSFSQTSEKAKEALSG